MGISLPQILVVLAIVVLLFGARRLPELGRSMGEAIKGFKKGISSEDDDSIDITNSADPNKIPKSQRSAQEEKKTEKNKA